MSNYATLKSAIQSAVYTNGNGEITGAGLQAVLLQIVNTVGDGYVFKGVANAGTSAGTPDANVFYIAPAGTYTNFGSSYTVNDGEIGVFTYDGSWAHAAVKIGDSVMDAPYMADATVIASGNIFVPAYSVKNKYVNSSSPYDIIDLTGGIVSGFYKLPEDARTLVFSGVTLSIGNIFVRFSQTPSLTGTATTLQFTNDNVRDISQYYAQGYRYWCFTAYRGISAEGVDLSPVSARMTTGATDSVVRAGEVYEEVNGFDLLACSDGYIKAADGTEVSGGGYRLTPFIPVSEGDKIHWQGYASSAVMIVACYVTDSGNALTSAGSYVQGWNVTEVRSGVFVVPSGVNYIRASFNATYISQSSVSVGKTVLQRLDGCEDTERLLGGYVPDTVWTQGYIASDGTVVTVSGNYYYSDYIPVSEGDIYDVGCSGSASVLVLSGYGSQSQASIVGTFSVGGTGNYLHLKGRVPSGVSYIRVVYNTAIAGDGYYVRIGGKVDDIQLELEELAEGSSRNDTPYVSQLKRYVNISPKKASVVFEFDANQGSYDDAVAFASALKAGGINVATYAILSSQFNDSAYVTAFRQLQSDGNEICWHTLPEDSIGSSNPEPHPTVSDYRDIVARELAAFEGKGYATPIGVVTSQGAMVVDLIPPTKEYLCYGHTTANTPAKGTQESVLAAVNTTATDRYMINRIGLENLAEDDATVEATLLANAKAAIDKCVADGGLVVFYTHWYDNDSRLYWLRESVLTPLLAYIKAYIDDYVLVSATMADVANLYMR